MKRAILTAAVSLLIACSAHFNEARAVEVVLTSGTAFLYLSQGDEIRQINLNFTAPGMSFSASRSARGTGGGLTAGFSVGTPYPNVFEKNTGALIYNGVAYNYFSTTCFTTATTWYGSVYVYNSEFPTGPDNLIFSFNFIGVGTRELTGNSDRDGTMLFTVASASAPNPVDNTQFFVRQHYLDFLSREPDQLGWSFWIKNIESCGADAQCREVKRIDTSAAFFLSIEFQQTGFLVERMYKTAYGDAAGLSDLGGFHLARVPVVRFSEFLPDTRQVGRDVVVGVGDWERRLDDNKQAFALEFVRRQRFLDAFPPTMTAGEFVAKLDRNAGGVLSPGERAGLAESLGADAGDSARRAQALLIVAENAALVRAEFNRAFVLMQYFAYLRRDPDGAPDADHTGYDYWLRKLEGFGGDYIRAEMVKAFIASAEYRSRFGPQ